MCFNQTFCSYSSFEEESDRPSAVTAVPGLEAQICHIFQDMKEPLHQLLTTARKQSLRAFHTDSV